MAMAVTMARDRVLGSNHRYRCCLLDAASVFETFNDFKAYALRGSELYSPYRR
jgi:hypothetical protein